MLNGGNSNFESEQPVKQPSLRRNQKIAAVFLAVFAFLTITFWFVQLKKTLDLNAVLFKQAEEKKAEKSLAAGGEDDRSKDSDKDGLSDWDELNLYKTSPYLEDSDGDGLFDKAEIDAGGDPNCPLGKDCASGAILGGDEALVEEAAGDETSNVSLPESGLGLDLSASLATSSAETANSGETAADSQDMEALLQGTVDPATLRQMLISYGMSQDVLDKISDEQLMASFKDILSKQEQ